MLKQNLQIAYIGPTAAGKRTNLRALAALLPDHIIEPRQQIWLGKGFEFYHDQLRLNYADRSITIKANHGAILYQRHELLILSEVEGVVFVLDSQLDKLAQNIRLLRTSCGYLAQQGRLGQIAKVIQFNKRDLHGMLSLSILQRYCNAMNWPSIAASAAKQHNIIETLALLVGQC